MRTRIRTLGAAALLSVLSLLLGACSSENNDTETLGTDPNVTEGGTPRVFAEYEPIGQSIPLPNDIVWLADGDPEVEFAVTAGDPLAGLKQTINGLNLLGLSPNMFLTVPVTGTVDAGTVQLTAFRTDDPKLRALLQALATKDLPAAGAALAQMEIRTEADFVAVAGEGVLKLLPRRALTPGGAYAVAVKRTLEDNNGFLLSSSPGMEALKSQTPFPAEHPYARVEKVRAGYNDPNLETGAPGLFDVVAAVTGARYGKPWTRDDVLVLWTFHTASVTLTTSGTLPYEGFSAVTAQLKQASSLAWKANGLQWLDDAGAAVAAPTPVTMDQLADDLAAQGADPEIQGFVAAAPQDSIDGVYFGQFQSPSVPSLLAGSPAPTAVPFLLVTPKGAAKPYPVVVYQHGIGRTKYDALLTADAFAARGMATLAIDAPFHGDRFAGEPFLTLDLGKDRLNFYQAALDLWETLDVVEAGALDLDGNPATVDVLAHDVRFAAQSLGSIIGSVFLSQDTRPVKIHLASPSAQFLNVVDETHRAEGQLVTSLGYPKGSTSYYVFLNVAQWLLDPVDGMYTGIGANSLDELMAVTAYGDPQVSEASSFSFLSAGGVDAPTTVTPPFAAPSSAAGAYRYGTAEAPVIHFFTLAPEFDTTTEPWYTGYSPAIQQGAWAAAQDQAAEFLAAEPLAAAGAN